MDPALRALLTGLVDYAGLFPPAKLDMAPAVRNHLEYRAGADRFMLGRFICPVGRLEELGACLDVPADEPLGLSAILRGDALADDLVALREFEYEMPVRTQAFEVRVPDAIVVERRSGVSVWIEEFRDLAEAAGFGDVPSYLEMGWPEAVVLHAVMKAIGSARERGRSVHLKIRTGGLEASAFPTPARVAAAILACRNLRVPLKATAGLHHPVRRHDEAVGATMHGFLNVFGGAVLAGACGLDETEVIRILEDEDPASFRFEDGTFSWREHRASVADVERWRRDLVHSFGSCSFDEPREDLETAGFIR